MQVRFKSGAAVLTPESEAETQALSAFAAPSVECVFALSAADGGVAFEPLGPRAEVCREPINVYSANPDPRIAIVANFSPTPFTLDGVRYACIEAFWQSLRFPETERARIAALDGFAAKRESEAHPYGSHVHYRGEAIPAGAYAHWQLMRRACEAKFAQNADARAALLATGHRPLVHRVNPDSRTIPGAIMAEIWMDLRAKLRGDPQPAYD